MRKKSGCEYLYQQEPEGFPFFPSVLGYGDVICPSVFPVGYVLIISFVEGERLSNIWDQSAAEKQDILLKCREAVTMLRSLRIRVRDPGKHNVLYPRQSKKATLIDVESVGQCGRQDARTLGRTRAFDDLRERLQVSIGRRWLIISVA